MKLVPVPTPNVADTWVHWWPWLSACAKHNGENASDYVRDLRDGTRQIHLLWDPDTKRCHGIVGTEILTNLRGDKICHLIWTTGKGRQDWQGLIVELERWAREHVGCKVMKATARPGWRPHLKAHGYRVRHIIAHKDL